jgi:predicted dehydrogenase
MTANVVFDREVEDTAIAAMRFASGPCATVTVTHAAGEPRDTFRIFGTAGSIHIPALNGAEMVVTASGQERRERLPPPANLHQPLVADFVDAVRTGRPPAVDGAVGRAVAVVESAIYDVRTD